MHNPEGYWPRGNGACGKPDTYQSGNGILGRTHDPTILRLSVCLSVCLSLSLYSMTDVSVPFSFHNVHPIRASLSDLCPTRHPFAYRHWHAAACIPLSSIACRRLGISMLISCDVWLNGGYYGPWADHNVVSQRETRRESSDFLPKLSTFNWLVRAIFNDCNEHVAYIATATREIS